MDTNLGLVSIVMPAFNVERFIGQAIQSVIDQTYEHWELLIVDDGSVDDTSLVVKKYIEAEDRVQYFFQKNAGQASARNSGLKKSKGGFIAFLDSDDCWMPGKLCDQMKLTSKNQIDLLFTNGEIINEKDRVIGFLDSLYKTCFNDDSKLLEHYINGLFFIPTSSVLIRRRLVEEFGVFDDDKEIQNAEDFDLWLRFISSGATLLGMRDSLIRYRQHSNQNTSEDYASTKQVLAVLNKYLSNSNIGKNKVVKAMCSRVIHQNIPIEVYDNYLMRKLSIRYFHVFVVRLFGIDFHARILRKFYNLK